MNKFKFILGFILCTTFSYAQNWTNAGFTPGQEIGFEKDGNTLWKLTINNIYKSTDGGNSWVQNVDATAAPFYAADYFPNNFGTNTPTFDHEDSRVFGDFMFLGLRNGCCSASEFWTTPDAGLSFDKFEFDGDFFLEAYNLGSNRYMIQIADFDNTNPSFYRSKWYLSTNGGQSFTQVLHEYGRNARIVGQAANTIMIHDVDRIYYHDVSTLSLTQTVTLPEEAQTAKVVENTIRAISYDAAQNQTATNIKLHSSTNGGASFSTTNNTKPTGSIFDFSIVDDYLFFELGISLYRYNLNDFAAPANIFATDVTPDGPFKKTLDGSAMVNSQVTLFNGSEFTFNNPIYTSTNNWSSVTPTPKIPFALEAMAQFGNSYSRFYGKDAYTSINGFDFQLANDFFGSALKDDIIYLEDAMYVSVYSDPSSTAFFSNDGINFTPSKDLNGITATDADFFQAGDNLIIRPIRVGDPLNLSTDNGNTWTTVPNSYAWGRYMFVDQKNGTLYGYQKTFGGNESIELAKSTDNGVTWTFIDTNVPYLNQVDFNGHEGRPFMAYNNHIFLKNGDALLRSSDGGLTFNPVSFPNSFHNACVWINDGKLHVDTQDENIYTVNIDQWLGAAPAATQAGYQIDLALSIRLEPENPAPFSDFDVIVTLTNQGNRTADRIGIKRPFLSSPVAVQRGSEQPVYSPNFAWTNSSINSLAPGESATASFPYYRLDGGPIETNAFVSSALQPDVDSRPGAIANNNNPEDDEAVFPSAPAATISFENCPADVTVSAIPGATGAVVNYFPPSFTNNCAFPLVDFGPAPGTQTGNVFPIGTTTVTWVASAPECGTATCTFDVTVLGDNSAPSTIDVVCPFDIYKEEATATEPTGQGFTGFGDAVLPFPTATTNCPGGITSIEYIGSAPTFSRGIDLWVDGPGIFDIVFEIKDACGTVSICSYIVEIAIPTFEFEFTNCPSDIVVTAPAGANGRLVNYGPLNVMSNCVIFGTNTELIEGLDSGSVFPIGTTTVTHLASNQQCGTTACTFNVTVLSANQGTGLDLELSMTQGIDNPVAFSTFQRTVTVTNTGTLSASGIEVSIPLADGMVFSGGAEFVASQGSYSAYGNQNWTVGTLGAGQSADIVLTYFPLENITEPGYAQIIANNGGSDIDSTPNNGTPPAVNEDDEASTSGGTVGGNGLVLNCPGNFEIVLEPLATTGPVDYSFTATSDCPSGEVSIAIEGAAPGQIGIFGLYPITITATDGCGRTETCSFEVTLKTAPVDATQVICVDDITVTAADVNGAIVTWEAPEVISDCSPFLQTTFPASGSLLPIGTTEVIFVYGEAGPLALCGNTSQCKFNVTVLPPNGGGNEGIDLELAMTQSIEAPKAFETFSRVVTVTNNGTLPATNIDIDIPIFDGMVFSGGNEYNATQGNYQAYSNQLWSVGNLQAGQSASISLTYFALENISSPGYAQVFSMSGNDIDSTPNNGTPPTVNEDDEASTESGTVSQNLPDLTISNFNFPSIITIGQLTDYSFDLNNLGQVAATSNFKIELYLSTDNTLSNNDIFIGEVNTGNTFPGTISNVGAQAIANSANPGNYRLIVIVDANDNINESNENNNILTLPVQVGSNALQGADIELSAEQISLAVRYNVYTVSYIASNTGTTASSDVQVSIPVPDGVVLSGGDEFEATKGSLGIYFDDVWRIGSLSPGETVEIDVNYYKLSTGNISHYAQVSFSAEDDPDSTPNNGICCNAIEDDEASLAAIAVSARTFDNTTSDLVKEEAYMKLYPNPATGTMVNMLVYSTTEKEQEIYIYDLLGREVSTQKFYLYRGENTLNLSIQLLSSGMYQVVLVEKDGPAIIQKLVIEK